MDRHFLSIFYDFQQNKFHGGSSTKCTEIAARQKLRLLQNSRSIKFGGMSFTIGFGRFAALLRSLLLSYSRIYRPWHKAASVKYRVRSQIPQAPPFRGLRSLLRRRIRGPRER